MDCELFKYLWRLGRGEDHRELGESLISMRNHEATCESCGAWVASELSVDGFLSREIARVNIPSGMGDRIRKRLDGNPTNANPAGLIPSRPPISKSWIRVGILAATVMLLVSGWGFYALTRPIPLTDDSWNLFWDDCFAWEVSPPDRERVANWFSSMGIRTELPQEVNYQHLVSHGIVVWDGRQVPQLVFANPDSNGGRPAIAKVLVLSSKQFRLESLFPLPGGQEGSRTRVDFLPESNEKSLYLVSHAGEKMDWLIGSAVSASSDSR